MKSLGMVFIFALLCTQATVSFADGPDKKSGKPETMEERIQRLAEEKRKKEGEKTSPVSGVTQIQTRSQPQTQTNDPTVSVKAGGTDQGFAIGGQVDFKSSGREVGSIELLMGQPMLRLGGQWMPIQDLQLLETKNGDQSLFSVTFRPLGEGSLSIPSSGKSAPSYIVVKPEVLGAMNLKDSELFKNNQVFLKAAPLSAGFANDGGGTQFILPLEVSAGVKTDVMLGDSDRISLSAEIGQISSWMSNMNSSNTFKFKAGYQTELAPGQQAEVAFVSRVTGYDLANRYPGSTSFTGLQLSMPLGSVQSLVK